MHAYGVYIYICIHTRIQIWSNTHIHLHTHIYIALYIYIYISLPLSSSTVYICIWFPLVSHHIPMVCSPSPRLWTAYRHELKRLPPRWLPGTGCAMPVCPGYGWHGMGCWWWGGRWDSISNTMQQVTWIYATGITGIRKQLGFERQTWE